MSELNQDNILKALSRIKVPGANESLADLDMISNILISDGKVIFSINVPADKAQEFEPLRQEAEKIVAALPGVQKTTIVLTAEQTSSANSQTKQANPNPALHKQNQRLKAGVPGIAHIVAVASGKGGVGKSTTAVNLALALQKQGLKTGVLDADIYGPSMPRLLGIAGKPTAEGKILQPMLGYGLKIMSMGFLVEEAAPMIWRGPMVISALTQLLREVAWGALDVLVVDMPPGTGDAQLTMSQQVPLAGAVIVSTPQDIALIDARKGLNMFKKVDVPILGIIENMSYFQCPKCGERSDIFGHGGAMDEAAKLNVPFLGSIPLHIDIRAHSDKGTPIVESEPDSEYTAIYLEIAKRICDELKDTNTQMPTISFQ